MNEQAPLPIGDGQQPGNALAIPEYQDARPVLDDPEAQRIFTEQGEDKYVDYVKTHYSSGKDLAIPVPSGGAGELAHRYSVEVVDVQGNGAEAHENGKEVAVRGAELDK